MQALALIFSLLMVVKVQSFQLDKTKYCFQNQNKTHSCVSYESLVQDSGSVLPKYVINMDLTYRERWRQVITDFKNPIQVFFARLEQLQTFKDLQSQIPFYSNKQFLKELKAISDLAEVNFNSTQIISQMYELLNMLACTTILARSGNGSIIHARNFDYSYMKFISPLLAQIEFQKKGRTVFYADMIVGTAIVITGIVPNGFSITINQRESDDQTISFLKKQQFIPACYLIYKVLQTKTTYDEAVRAFSEANIAMPAYFIVAGLSGNQGVVVQKDRERVDLTTTLSDQQWFICQTNYDRQEEDPEDDYRRIPCEEKMSSLDQKTIKKSDIYKILSEPPNFSYDTIATDIMIPKSSYFKSTRWFNSKKT